MSERPAPLAGSSKAYAPRLALVIGIAAVSSGSIFARFAQAEAPSLTVAAFRLSLAALFLLPVAWLRYRQATAGTQSRGLALVAGLGLLSRRPFRHLDHFPGIHFGRQLRGAGIHLAALGRPFFLDRPARALEAIPGDRPGRWPCAAASSSASPRPARPSRPGLSWATPWPWPGPWPSAAIG